MKYVQITRELFFKLLSYHLLDKFEEKEEIEKGLEAKLNTMHQRKKKEKSHGRNILTGWEFIRISGGNFLFANRIRSGENGSLYEP